MACSSLGTMTCSRHNRTPRERGVSIDSLPSAWSVIGNHLLTQASIVAIPLGIGAVGALTKVVSGLSQAAKVRLVAGAAATAASCVYDWDRFRFGEDASVSADGGLEATSPDIEADNHPDVYPDSSHPDVQSRDGGLDAPDAGVDSIEAPGRDAASDISPDSSPGICDDPRGHLERITRGFDGSMANGGSGSGLSISSDGRYVTFSSSASNLVRGDTNGVADIFVYDRLTGTTERVSVGVSGAEANGQSNFPSISADGQAIAFQSEATNLVRPFTANHGNFVYDRRTRTTELVTVFPSMHNYSDPRISPDGQHVGFTYFGDDIVPGDSNRTWDVFLFDRGARTLSIASRNWRGEQGTGQSAKVALSFDASTILFSTQARVMTESGDSSYNVIVKDMITGNTEIGSTTMTCSQADREASSGYNDGQMSPDGRYITFTTPATNMLARSDTDGNFDVYLRDRLAGCGALDKVSVGVGGEEANGNSSTSSVSNDGRFVAFKSEASNLVAGDTNGVADVFVRDRRDGITRRISIGPDGYESDIPSSNPVISGDGRYVAFYGMHLDPTVTGELAYQVYVVSLECFFRFDE